MATKRPLQQLEKMVTALPPAPTEKKSKKDKKIKIKKPPQVDPSSPPPVPSTPTTTTLSPPPVPPPPPTPLINMDDLFNGDNILNLLNPPAASYQVQLPPMEQACQSVVCPMHQTDLTCFSSPNHRRHLHQMPRKEMWPLLSSRSNRHLSQDH